MSGTGVFKKNIFVGIIEASEPSDFVLNYWQKKGKDYKLRAWTKEDQTKLNQGFKVKY
jgi:hypothetical protein